MSGIILRPNQDQSRREEIGIVGLIELGKVNPPHAVARYDRVFEEFRVVATKHNMNWPGTEQDTLFAVEGYGWHQSSYQVIYMWGFFNETDCYDFLTGQGKKQYPVWDRFGVPGMSEPRERLHFPDSWIRRYAGEADC